MSMLNIHQEALQSRNIPFHELLQSYSSLDGKIYIFVEGKDDLSFYRYAFRSELPHGWPIQLIPVKGKRNVLFLYEQLDWTVFAKKKVLFLVDKDLSDYISEQIPKDINIYSTDYYSIENTVASEDTLLLALEEIYSISLSPIERKKILNCFNQMSSQFYSMVMPIMAWVIAWRQGNKSVQLGNLHINKYVKISSGKFIWANSCANELKLRESLSHDLQLSCRGSITKQKYILKLLKDHNPKSYIRGKYDRWCFVKILKHITENINLFSSHITRTPAFHVEVSDKNAIQILGPRSTIPDSLVIFIKNTAAEYIVNLSQQ
jgi:hypothetical protein